MSEESKASLLKALGPGILFASTAIGVSHLVQSTRAGATYGLALLWAVILANLFKYPFFEFGSRFAISSGFSLIQGFRQLGRWALHVYILVTLASMFFVAAAVTAVTASFFDNLLGLSSRFGLTVHSISLILMASSSLILVLGRYRLLDSLIKVIASCLTISTVVAFILCVKEGPMSSDLQFSFAYPSGPEDLAFMIALMGWMPTAVDLSAWNSLWTLERNRMNEWQNDKRSVLLDFDIGYMLSAGLAICFVVLGAFLFHGTGTELSMNSARFAHQVVGMYTEVMGSWTYWLIATASFSIMLGTCIAVFDGYARSFDEIFRCYREAPFQSPDKDGRHVYTPVLLILAVGAYLIIRYFGGSMRSLVDIATTISFLIAPVIAMFNLRLVHAPYVRIEDEPPRWLRYLAYAGILFLMAFGILFLTA